jgi:hypothetical protein
MLTHARRASVLALFAAMFAVLVFAADPAGDWKGSFDFNGSDVPLTFHLKVKDASLTGTIEGLPTTPTDIKDGKVEGDTLSFNTTTDYQGNPVKLLLKGKLDGDQIKFSMGTEDGGWGVEFVAKRAVAGQ